MNPYWTMKNDAGEWNKIFTHISSTMFIPNNIYNATTTSFTKGGNTILRNNSRARYAFGDSGLRAEGAFSVWRNTGRTDRFLASAHTTFIAVEELRDRGMYSLTNTMSDNWETNLTLTYGKKFGEKHSLNANFRTGLLGVNTVTESAVGTGFLNDAMNAFHNAVTYQQNKGESVYGPGGSEEIRHEVSYVGNLNYYYDQRYFVDLNVSYNGGSSFGDNSRWKEYYALGAGWNIHNEHFFNVPWISLMRAKYSYGVSGSANYISPFQAMTVYTYVDELEALYHNSQGAYIAQYGNPDLDWQSIYMSNAELNLNLFEDRVQMTGTWYRKLTRNANMPLSLSESHGYGEYEGNVGEMLNEGWEAKVSASIINTEDFRLNAFANFAHNTNIVKKLSDEIKRQIYDQGLEGTGSTNELWYMFQEGRSMRSVYAMESWGIDPMTGRRIYINENGTPQMYSASFGSRPRVYIGDNDPLVNGSASVSVWWKGLQLTASFQYRWGGYALNQTVLGKVENLVWSQNIDRRVYTDRWRKPGDLSLYKGIGLNDATTWPNTHFVQKDNMLSLSALNLSYEFPHQWLQRNLGLENLTVGTYISDVWYSSTIWRERGTSYPFSYNPNFTLRCAF
jgi:hypothetical protein